MFLPEIVKERNIPVQGKLKFTLCCKNSRFEKKDIIIATISPTTIGEIVLFFTKVSQGSKTPEKILKIISARARDELVFFAAEL